MSSPIRSTAADTSEDEVNLDDTTTEVGNNSILGKVKSRVTSIFPNSFSKWFSPSTRNQNDSQNGSLNMSNSSGINRRRRRIEIEAEEEDDDELAVEEEEEEEAEDDTEQQQHVHRRQYAYGHTIEEKTEDDGNNSDEENINETTPTPKISLPTISSRRSINREEQPPNKRLRDELYDSHMRDRTLMSHHPLVASTPAVGSQMRGLSTSAQLTPRSNANRKHLNLSKYYNSEQPYNFAEHLPNATNTFDKQKPNIIDLMNSSQGVNSKLSTAITADSNNEYISSRRNLNISSATTTVTTTNTISGLSSHRRPPLSSYLNDAPSTSTGVSHRTTLASTSATTETEIRSSDAGNRESEESSSYEENSEISASNNNNNNNTKYNGRTQTVATHGNKRQKLYNGNNAQEQESNNNETASEESEGSGSTANRKNCLANTANSSRAGSRTSSFGNGLNFYAHLEGRKSLFSGQNVMGNRPQPFNNSTLSLTSLNRRQFNASIYGSTSALSDSRLLDNINTASPFYKGRTTYGGAAAYNKYSATGAGASSPRITPTPIRPTSSLSTLSSSNASVVGVGSALGLTQNKDDHPHLSNTAKGILNIINDFSTPLNEVRKLANNLKANNQHQPLTPQTRNRLNESNLHASRTMRLSQVTKPYARAVVTLKPTQYNGTNNTNNSSFVPPVRELQVPSMSQLLQMKKIQSSTERSRQITSKNINQPAVIPQKDYTLPIQSECNETDGQKPPQKHTSKIRSKVSSTARVTGSKAVVIDESPPSPVNLPNIAFPLMTSMPKIDIQLPAPASTEALSKKPTNAAPTSSNANLPATFSFNSTTTTASTSATDTALSTKTSANAKPMFSFNTSNSDTKVVQIKSGTSSSVDHIDAVQCPSDKLNNNLNFKFSSPVIVELTEKNQISTMAADVNNFKFSPPAAVIEVQTSAVKETEPVAAPVVASVPKLKTGSVLDALKGNNTTLCITNTFGSQFKKSANEWECDTCMIRNKAELTKCVACETPRKSDNVVSTTAAIPATNSLPVTSSFGSQFQKAANEWECDACMVRNKADAAKCIACETPKKGAASSGATTTTALPTVTNSFGDAFKSKANSWECPTCLINNKSDASQCVACETKNPSGTSDLNANKTNAAAPTTTFKFGFAAAQTTPAASTAATTQDASFKSIAAQQKAASWECEACMTRNDAARNKCICCEQAKPGTQATSDAPSTFSFGSSAASKFSFGFPANTVAATPAKDKTDETAKDKKSNAFGTVSSSSGATATTTSTASFSFGFQPTSPAQTNNAMAKKDAVDSATPAPVAGIKFGASAAAVTPTQTTSTATATPTTSTTATSSFKFGLANTTSTTSSAAFTLPTATTTESAKPTGFGSSFAFGTTSAPKDTEAKPAAAGTTADFAFKVPPSPATGNATNSTESSKSDAVATPPKPLFSFGTPAASTSAATTTTSAAPAVTSSFTFGSNAAPANKTLFGIVSSSSSTPSITTPTASNIFGSGTSSGSSTTTTTTAVTSTTSTFGSFTAPSAASNVFGSFGQPSAADAKPAAAATPLFGNMAANSLATNSVTPSFTFGTATTAATNTTTSGTLQSTASWPKKTFVFGSGGDASNNSNTSTDASKPTLFGTFGMNSNTNVSAEGGLKSSDSAPPAYGALGSAATTTQPPPPAYGSTMFGANTNTPALGTTNIFGTSTSGNATTPQVPAFGAAPAFGGSASAASATPTFGSTAATAAAGTTFGNSTALSATPTFGSFSAAAAAAAGTSSLATTTTNNPDMKKPEPFKFTNPSDSQATTGIFKFGASNATAAPKPAFNLTATTTIQPSFNFTGATEPSQMLLQQQPQTQQAKPFQFGAITSPPVFNFSGGAVEANTNARRTVSATTATENARQTAATAVEQQQQKEEQKQQQQQPFDGTTTTKTDEEEGAEKEVEDRATGSGEQNDLMQNNKLENLENDVNEEEERHEHVTETASSDPNNVTTSASATPSKNNEERVMPKQKDIASAKTSKQLITFKRSNSTKPLNTLTLRSRRIIKRQISGAGENSKYKLIRGKSTNAQAAAGNDNAEAATSNESAAKPAKTNAASNRAAQKVKILKSVGGGSGNATNFYRKINNTEMRTPAVGAETSGNNTRANTTIEATTSPSRYRFVRNAAASTSDGGAAAELAVRQTRVRQLTQQPQKQYPTAARQQHFIHMTNKNATTKLSNNNNGDNNNCNEQSSVKRLFSNRKFCFTND